MKPYIFTATDKSGRRQTEGREAQSIEHLRTMLECEGWRDIEFIDGEDLAALRTRWSPSRQPGTRREFRFHARQLQSGYSRRMIVLEALRKNKLFIGSIVALFAIGLWLRRWDWALWVVLAGGVAWWLLGRRVGVAGIYDELQKAFALGENDRAQALIEKLRVARGAAETATLAVDLVAREAVLLARRGRLDEGLHLMESLRGNEVELPGYFENRMASVHYAAGRIDDFVAWTERACETSGHSQMQMLDLAFVHARFGDVDRARVLLAGINVENLIALHRGIHQAAEGVGFLRVDELDRACEHLCKAVEILKPFGNLTAAWPFQGIVAGYAAIALVRAGRRDAARAVLEPWLQVANTCIDPRARQLIQTEVLQ